MPRKRAKTIQAGIKGVTGQKGVQGVTGQNGVPGVTGQKSEEFRQSQAKALINGLFGELANRQDAKDVKGVTHVTQVKDTGVAKNITEASICCIHPHLNPNQQRS